MNKFRSGPIPHRRRWCSSGLKNAAIVSCSLAKLITAFSANSDKKSIFSFYSCLLYTPVDDVNAAAKIGKKSKGPGCHSCKLVSVSQLFSHTRYRKKKIEGGTLLNLIKSKGTQSPCIFLHFDHRVHIYAAYRLV